MRLLTLFMKHLIFSVIYIFLALTLIDSIVVVNGELTNLTNISQPCVGEACNTPKNLRSSQNKNVSCKRKSLPETPRCLEKMLTGFSPKNVTCSFSIPFLINKYLNFKKQCPHYSSINFFKRNLPSSILSTNDLTLKYKMYQNMVLEHASSLATRHEFWPSLGVYFFSQKILVIYTVLKSNVSKQWYLKSVINDPDIKKDPLLSLAVSIAISMLSGDLTMFEAISSSFNSKSIENLCAKKNRYLCVMHSIDENADFVDASQYCSALEKDGIIQPFSPLSHKRLLSEKKFNIEIGDSYDFDKINSAFYIPSWKKEKENYYLLALKAIENLNRWFDYHRFCSTSMLFGLKKDLLDIEILPTWKSVHYFYVHLNKTITAPAAVLAKKVEKSAERSKIIIRYLLVIRDARTTMEGFSQIDTDLLGNTDIRKSGTYLQGYAKVFAISASGVLENILRSEAKTLTSNHTIHFTVIAKGFYGVGTGLIILRELIDSLTPDTLIDSHFVANATIRYSMLAFSSGLIGDEKFYDYLKRRATLRHIVEKDWFFNTKQNLLYPCETEEEFQSFFFKFPSTTPNMIQLHNKVLNNINSTLEDKFEILKKFVCPIQSPLEQFSSSEPESVNNTIGCHRGQKNTFILPKF